MFFETESLAGILSKWRLPSSSLMIIMMFIYTVQGQYSWVQPYDEISIGYPVRPSSPSIDQVLLTDPDRVLFYSAHFRNCNVMDVYISVKGDVWPTMTTCSSFGKSRFMVRGLQPDTDYLLHLRKKHNNIALIKLPFHTPKEDMAPPNVPWHYVAASGPGWIDLRWSAPHTIPHQLVTFKIEHWRVTAGNDPVSVYSAYPILSFVDVDSEIMPRVKPALPCPQWKTYDIYCQILTSMIFPWHSNYDDFHDWMVKITTYRVVLQRPGESYPDTKHPSPPYVFMARSWDCDTTTGQCPKLLRSVPFHKEYTLEPTERAKWGIGKAGMMYPSNLPTIEMVTDNLTAIDRGYLDPDAVARMRWLWPLFLILCIVILFIILPFFFYYFKRETRDRVIMHWYGWASPDGRINYAVAMPPDTSHLSPMRPEAYDDRRQELEEQRQLQEDEQREKQVAAT